jgi:hypothetical protein
MRIMQCIQLYAYSVIMHEPSQFTAVTKDNELIEFTMLPKYNVTSVTKLPKCPVPCGVSNYQQK